MIDLIAIAVLVLLVIRGWSRGFVRQALDVLTLVLGAVLAFRLAPAAGRLLAGLFGWSPELARVVGGATLFIALSIAAGFAASAIHRSMHRLPGTSLLNSIAGAALGAVYAIVLAIAAVTLLSALPLPAAVAGELEDSQVAERVVDPDGPAQRAVEAMSGDRAVQSMIWLRRFAGDWLFDASDQLDLVLPVTDESDARPSARAADAVTAAIDGARHEEGLAPLQWSDDLAVVAVARAGSIYRSGSFAADQPLEERLELAGITPAGSAERLLLAPTIEGVGKAIGSAGSYREAGIGIVDGPYGMLTVLVLVGDA
jgi:membrane protein required for colicin V production